MRLFNYLSKTKLFVSLLLCRNYNSVTRVLPTNYYSIKTIKQYYYKHNNYYDLYTFMNDLVSFKTINDCDKDTSLFFDKYNKLTNIN